MGSQICFGMVRSASVSVFMAHKTRRDSERGGADSQGALWFISCGFLLVLLWQHEVGSSLTAQLSNQVTSSWQTQTHAHTDVNTQGHIHTYASTHTVHAACSCCQWCQPWFGQTSLLFCSTNTEERRRLHLAVEQVFFCLKNCWDWGLAAG